MSHYPFFKSLSSLLLYSTLFLTASAFGPTAYRIDNGKPPRRFEKTEAEWKKLLTPAQFTVTRKSGTERPNSSPLTHNHERGTYRCVSCHEPLFGSGAKFESGTGWPSFSAPLRTNVLKNVSDTSYGTVRTEIQCAVCDAHLGHVFADGPAPTGLRYCMNGVALEFIKKP